MKKPIIHLNYFWFMDTSSWSKQSPQTKKKMATEADFQLWHMDWVCSLQPGHPFLLELVLPQSVCQLQISNKNQCASIFGSTLLLRELIFFFLQWLAGNTCRAVEQRCD